MKAIQVQKPGAPFEVVDNVEIPQPSPDQILVKSLYTAVNPVDGMMADMGLLVREWPLVPGVDASGVIVKVGGEAASRFGFNVGDEVCGCTRLGAKNHSTFEEYFLMDAALTIPKPKNLSTVEAATIGVGVETAALGIFNGLDVEVPDPKYLPAPKDEWVVVLGGASSVGKSGVQLLKVCGYKVIASCSVKSGELVKKQGADAIFDYTKSVEEQVKDVLAKTNGQIHRVLDAAATGDAFGKALFKELTTGPKLFSTTNGWSDITDFENGRSNIIQLGPIGTPEGTETNKSLESWIPVFVALFEAGKLFPSPYEVVGSGFEAGVHALKQRASGSSKIVVKIQDK